MPSPSYAGSLSPTTSSYKSQTHKTQSLPQSKRRETGENVKTFHQKADTTFSRQLSAKVDTLDSQLKEQLKSNSLLLSKLVKIRGEGRDDVKVQAVLDLLDDPGLEVADVLRREKILLDNLKKSKPSSPVQNALPRKESSLHKEVVAGVFERQPVHPEEDPAEGEEEEEEEDGANEDKEGEEQQANTVGAESVEDGDGDIGVEEKDLSGAREHNVIPLLLFSCNRPTVNRF